MKEHGGVVEWRSPRKWCVLAQNTRSQRSSIFFGTILLAILLADFELLSFTFTKLRPDLFDRREAFLSQLRSEDFERFKQQFASDTIGWDNPAGQNSVAAKLRRRGDNLYLRP